MKYYATQFGTNGSITRQIELGDALSVWENIGSVTDSDGNCYWYRDKYFGVIYADGTQPTPAYYDINALGSYLNEPQEIFDIKLSRGGTYLYVLHNSAMTHSSSYISKIATSDLSTAITVVYLAASYATRLLVDLNDYLWVCSRVVVVDGSTKLYRRSGTDLTDKGQDEHNGGRTIAMDSRGYCWGWTYMTSSSVRISRWMEDPTNPTAIIENSALNANCRLNGILDAVCWTDGTDYFAYCLKNSVADTTTDNIIYKIDITDPDAPVDPVAITLTGLTNCYNLHVDYDGNIYFSSYGVDGYNTYKIDKTTHAVTLYSGVGTQTIGNDPFAFFLSDNGHTGVV